MARGKDKLYRRSGILCFRYQDGDGVWREKSTGERKREQARDFKKKYLHDLEYRTLPNEKAEQIVAEACSKWVEQHSVNLTSRKGKANEKSYLRQLIKSRLGLRKLKSLSLDDLKDYQRARGEQVQPHVINRELRILINVLKEGNVWSKIGEHYKPLKEPESDVGEALSVEQLARLESTAATKDSWQVAYCAEVLAANTGLRGGEIKRLRLGMVDLENRRLRIVRTTTKSNAGARLVELNQAAMAAVTKLFVRAQALGANAPEHYLLPADLSRHTKQGDPLKGGRGFDVTRHQMSWDTAWRYLRQAAARTIRETAKRENRDLTLAERETAALFEHLRFHNLRHSFISLMGERGVPLQVVGAMVGHMSAAMVRHYTHISNQAARKAVELLDKEPVGTSFVEVFVEKQESRQPAAPKLLN